MNSREFVIWLKGFTEACNDFTATPKQWDRIKEVLDEVQDYNDNPGIDVEIDDGWSDWYHKNPQQNTSHQTIPTIKVEKNGTDGTTIVGNGGIGFTTSTNYSAMPVWNCEPTTEGFGYYVSKQNEKCQKNKEKKLLND
jgi:hypothetical protein